MRCRGKGDAIPLLALFKKPRLLRRGVSLIGRLSATVDQKAEPKERKSEDLLSAR